MSLHVFDRVILFCDLLNELQLFNYPTKAFFNVLLKSCLKIKNVERTGDFHKILDHPGDLKNDAHIILTLIFLLITESEERTGDFYKILDHSGDLKMMHT